MCTTHTTTSSKNNGDRGTISQSMKSFVGNTIEICIATRDHKHTIEGMLRFGIGPWKTYTFNPENTTNQTYRGKPSPFTMKVCFAQTQNIVYKIIQPISGPNIFDEFLDKHGEGVYHIAFDCNGIPWEERVAGFKERGFQVAQSGSWEGKCHFAYLDSEDATTTCFEMILFEEGWEDPVADEEYDLTK